MQRSQELSKKSYDYAKNVMIMQKEFQNNPTNSETKINLTLSSL